jgi:hypothetical protein
MLFPFTQTDVALLSREFDGTIPTNPQMKNRRKVRGFEDKWDIEAAG